jgi:hypothetical protein
MRVWLQPLLQRLALALVVLALVLLRLPLQLVRLWFVRELVLRHVGRGQGMDMVRAERQSTAGSPPTWIQVEAGMVLLGVLAPVWRELAGLPRSKLGEGRWRP